MLNSSFGSQLRCSNRQLKPAVECFLKIFVVSLHICIFASHLPAREPKDVFRVDADGVFSVQWFVEVSGVRITHTFSRDAAFIATKSSTLRATIEARRQSAIRIECKTTM